MLLGDFGGLFGVLGGAGNRRKHTRCLVDFGVRLWGPEIAIPPPTTSEIGKVGVLPSRVLPVYLQQTTNLNHSLVAPVNRGRRIYQNRYLTTAAPGGPGPGPGPM